MQTQQPSLSVICKYVVVVMVILLFGGCSGDGNGSSTSPTTPTSIVGTWGLIFTAANAKDYDRIMLTFEDGTVKICLPGGSDCFYGVWEYDRESGEIKIIADHTKYGYIFYLDGTVDESVDIVAGDEEEEDLPDINGSYRTSDGRSGTWTADFIGKL